MWTYKLHTENVLIKQQAVKDKGYECEIWIYNHKGEKLQIIK